MLSTVATEGAVVIQDASAPRAGIWRFGTAVLDEQVAALRVAGATVELDRSSYDVLLALLRHAGEVVTKDELLEAGWPGRVVSENSLAKAVSRLRQALGAEGESIRAVHGYGYRLAATVSHRLAPVGAAPAHPHQAGHLHAGDALPHRPGWRLVRRLGEGSAGVIFLAQSGAGADGSVAARAVKLATSEAGLRSLKREIALARYVRAVRSDLPDVATVLDWNLNQPPFFLELPFFEHGNLADWAAAGTLPALALPARLRLCARLCDAVAALHELGIIHHDLKPENLYPVADADGDWRLVLSDLGAGAAMPAPGLAELGITMSLAVGDGLSSPRAGSLLYMAPEVIAGQLPTQRSDVFALGVLVYQLAVGDLRRSLAPGWETDIDDELLREDIALAAAANPLRRQIDARGLAERLRTLATRRAAREAERREQQRAVQREQDLVRERNRRRLWLATAAASALGLVGMLGMYVYADGERRAAERNAQQRQALIDFVIGDILAHADPYRTTSGGTALTVREAVDQAAANVDQRFGRDPAAAAAVHELVGSVYFGQDQHARAIAHYVKARDLFERRRGALNADDRVRIHARLCDVYRIGNRIAEAEAACAAALAAAHAPANRDFALLKLGQLHAEKNRFAEALAVLEPLLESPALRADTKTLGELYWSLGLCERGLGRYPRAQRHFEALLALYRRSGERSTWTAWAYNSLGSVLVETGDYARAEPLLVEARRIFVLTQGDGVEAQMPNIWRTEIRLRSGRWAEAKAMLQEAQAVWSRSLEPAHPLRLRAEANRAWAEAMLGERDSARRRLQAALRDRAQVFDRDDERIAPRVLRWLRTALALDDLDRAGQLLPLLERALAREMPYPHPVHAETACLRGRLALAQGRTGAAATLRACRAELLRSLAPRHPLVREAEAWLAQALSASPTEVATMR